MARVDIRDGRSTGIIQQRCTEPLAVDGEIRCLPHQLVIPGRPVEVEGIRPIVGIGAQDNLALI